VEKGLGFRCFSNHCANQLELQFFCSFDWFLRVEVCKLEKLMYAQEFDVNQESLQNFNIKFETFYNLNFPGGVLRVTVLFKKLKSQENW